MSVDSPKGQSRGSGILLVLGLLCSIAFGVSLLLPLTMCPALENDWTEAILWSQVDPKRDEEILAALRSKHRFCKVCGGSEQVPLLKKFLHRPDTKDAPQFVGIASVWMITADQSGFDKSEDTCARVVVILSEAGIPYKMIGGKGIGVLVPEQYAEQAITILRGDKRAWANQNLDVITRIRRGPHR